MSDNDFTETLCFVVFLHLQQVNVATQIYPKKKQKKRRVLDKRKSVCIHTSIRIPNCHTSSTMWAALWHSEGSLALWDWKTFRSSCRWCNYYFMKHVNPFHYVFFLLHSVVRMVSDKPLMLPAIYVIHFGSLWLLLNFFPSFFPSVFWQHPSGISPNRCLFFYNYLDLHLTPRTGTVTLGTHLKKTKLI